MIKLLKFMTKKDWFQFFLIIVFVTLETFFVVKLPESMAGVIAKVQISAPTSEIINAGLIMLLYAFIILVSVLLSGFFSAKVSANLCKTIRENLYFKVGNFSMKEIEKFSTASLITRSTNDITQLQQTYAISFRILFTAPFLAIFAISKIVGKSWQLSLTTAGFILLLTIFLIVLMIVVFPKFKLMQKRIDKLNLVSRENLTGIKVIRAYNAQEKQTKKFEETNKNFFDINIFLNKTMALLSPLMGIIMNGLSLTIVWFGSSLVGKEILNIENMMEFTQYSAILLISFTMLSMMFLILPRANVSAKRVREVLNSKSSIVDGEKEDVKDIGTIEFKNVSFSYDGSSEETIKNVSFKVEKGQTLAIIGSTGSGKSTIINLIMRFYDVNKGSILIDGENIKNIKLNCLYNKIGYSPQKSAIISGTVKENVGYGMDENKHEKEIDEALDVSQSKEFVEKLEKGVLSHISQGGNNLSGGQKQRISIARALAKNAEILLIDDSFSALDFLTDKKLRKELNKKYKDATKVIVAQRVGSIMDADNIIVLDNGKIAGQGTHKELLKSNKIYREIAYSQLNKEELEK